MRRILLSLLTAISLFSCGGGQTAALQEEGDTVVFKYATQLSVVRYADYTVATLKNPWKKGMLLHQYILVPDSFDLDVRGSELPEGTIIRTPLKRSLIFSTVHCAMLLDFGRQDCIAGVADLKYIKIPWIQEQVKAGRISDVGDGLSPVIEKIIDEHPDALFMSPFENSGGYGKLEEIHIPIVECAEYMESSPLARAEWLRFYGMLFGCEQRADSLFHATDSCYQALKTLAANPRVTKELTRNAGVSSASKSSGASAKSIVVDKVTGSVWYVPGGKSTIGQMVHDANGRYPWATDEHSGSVSMPFEAVLEKAGEADVWMFRYSSDHPMTRDELKAEHHGYEQFKALREGEVYGCNVECSPFYEETPFHPDWLLSDFIRILHPELQDLPPLRYYHRIQ